MFAREGSRWAQVAYLKASDAAEYGHFGASVALDGAMLLVGADRFEFDPGSAYVFTGRGATWSERAHLMPSDAGFELHGAEVALSGGVAVLAGVRASEQRRDDHVAPASLFVFTESGGRWTQARRVDVAFPARPDDAPSGGRAVEMLGSFSRVAVAMSPDAVAVGAVVETFNHDDPVYCSGCPAAGTYDRDVGAVTVFR